MPRPPQTPLQPISDEVLIEALSRTPADHFVIWNGRACRTRAGSICSRALALVHSVWEPVSLRELVLRAARLSGLLGLEPDAVRSAIRTHQAASPTSYFLARRTATSEYLAVADVPQPSSGALRLTAGDLILDRRGRRFDEDQEGAATNVIRALGAR